MPSATHLRWMILRCSQSVPHPSHGVLHLRGGKQMRQITTVASGRYQSTASAALRLYDDDDEDDYLENDRQLQKKKQRKQERPKTSVQKKASSTSSTSPIYVSATRQHVGKTTTSMALLSGLQKRFDKVGFMKPVGQQSLKVKSEDGKSLINVDKDAALVKEHFGLDHLKYEYMSPVLIPKGYTRHYLDGEIRFEDQEALVKDAYKAISKDCPIVLCEGTGHCAVGSIVHASNAQVASWLGAKMVLVANGGLGNTFDELELNKALCDREGVEVCGVIVNKVQPDKLEQTRTYIQKALDMHWGNGKVPLLGCIPDRPFLGCPALSDLERLFGSKLTTGSQHRLRHYKVEDLYLVATSLQVFLKTIRKRVGRKLYVCHASRNDILLGFLMDHPWKHGCEAAMIVTGTDKYPLSEQVLDIMRGLDENDEMTPPVLLVPQATHKVMEMIHGFTPKLNPEDAHRADTAIEHYEPFINFDLLLERTGHVATPALAAEEIAQA